MAMQLRDKIIPWYFVMFFLVVASVDAVMVTLAIKTNTGTITEHPYEKGLAYNKIIAEQEKQDALGWKGDISYDNGMLTFQLYDKTGNIINPDKMNVTFIRPVKSGMDFTLELKENSTKIDLPAKGLWEIRINAEHQGNNYQKSKRIIVN